MLEKIRENAYRYFHGHEVDGTNPSLLEALGYTDLNLLLDVGFNREVTEEAVLYWSKESGELSSLIDKADAMSADEIEVLGRMVKEKIKKVHSWEYIAEKYVKIFRN